MALPVILIDSTTGSDTQASGAGPSTALFGTTDASTDGAGTTVTLTSGTVLTSVATDGSHVIFLNDSTAGARNFGKITATAGSGGATPTVTVANAFGLSLSGKSWAIGGKRATIAGTTSAKFYSNNSAAGDAQPGWTLEMQSGHSETIAATQTIRRAGDLTTGAFTIQGKSGAATRPLLTFSNNGNAFSTAANYVVYMDFELRNTNATKTASIGIQFGSLGGLARVQNVKISHATNNFWKGIAVYTNSPIIDCEIGYCANFGVDCPVAGAHLIINCWIHDCTSHGINTVSGSYGSSVYFCGNLLTANGGCGILHQDTGASSANYQPAYIYGNTCDSNTSDGIKITAGSTGRPFGGGVLSNNILSNNGGYGVNLSGSPADALLYAQGFSMRGNAFYNNVSGDTNPASLPLTNLASTSGTNPAYTAGTTGGADYSIGTALKGLGYPLGGTLTIGTTSNTKSYVDPGVAQRQESGVGGTIVINQIINNFSGEDDNG